MIILIIILIISIVKSTQICDRFTSHYDFKDCGPADRRGIEEAKVCPDLGTWSCALFFCSDLPSEGNCSGGYDVSWFDCCTQKNIHYVDFWFTPYEDEGEDWEVQLYNILIRAEGSNITIGVTVHDTGQNILGNLTFISIVLDGHNDSSCETDLYFYINGNLSFVQLGITLDLYASGSDLLPYFKIFPKENQQMMNLLTANIRAPSAEDIYWLYTLGPNRTADVEICYDDEIIPSCTNGVLSAYRTATIVLSIALGVLLFLIILVFIWLVYTYFTGRASKKYFQMEEY